MGILGDYLPNWLPDDPNQNTAARQGLLSAGAALLGGRGDLGGILAGGLMAGQQGYNGALQQQQQAGLMAAQTQSLDLGNQQARAAIDRPMRLAAIAAGNYPGLQSSDPAAHPSVDAGPRIQPLSVLPQLGAPSVVQATGSTNPTSDYALNMDLSKRYALAGEYELAKQYNDMAIKSRPEVQEVKTALDASGKPVQVITFKDGSQRTSDYGALPDNQIVDIGGSQVLVDKYTGKQGASFAKSQSPDSIASNATTRRGQDMADRRSAESNENARGVIIQTDNGPMLANSRTGTTKPILGPDGKPVTRTKSLTEFEGKSAAFGDRAIAADKILRSLSALGPSGLGLVAADRPGTIKSVVSSVPLVGSGLGAVVNALPSALGGPNSNQQMAEQAQRDFINATLRQESGAAIGASEFENARQQYFPQPGDSEAVKKQKARNRQLVIEGFKRSAGSNAKFTNVDNGLPQGWTVEVH